jgi:hypothetical protein
MSGRCVIAVIACIAATALASPAAAQTNTAEIAGVVKDATEAMLARAVIVAFALPAPFTFGSAPRNSVIGPGYANVDVVLARTWLVAAGRTLELRWEVFSLFNRANFDLPNRVFGTPNFGRIFSAKDPRQMQIGMRLTF